MPAMLKTSDVTAPKVACTNMSTHIELSITN